MSDGPSYEYLYEHAPCGHLTASEDGRITTVNQSFLALTGYGRDEVVGRGVASLLTTGSALFYETRLLPVLRLRGEIREVALAIRRSDDTELSVLVNGTVGADPKDGSLLVQVAVFDSTARRDYERELLTARRAAEASEARVLVLQEASTAFGATESEESLAAALARAAGRACDATAMAVLLAGDTGLRVATGTHPLGSFDADDPTRPESVALRNNSVVTIGDLVEAGSTYPALVAPMVDARLEAVMVTPLADDEEPLGVVVCAFGRRRRFDDAAVDLQEALARHAAQVLRRIRLQNRLESLATYDQLTGLANRKLLEHQLLTALSSAERHDQPMAVMFLDLDGFKAVNDLHGHTVGDAVLREVAQRLSAATRASDTVARFGGDEFVVVCQDTSPEAAMVVAARVQAVIREPLTGDCAGLSLGASVGMALHRPARGRTATPDELLREADAAMYTSKRSGKDQLTIVAV